MGRIFVGQDGIMDCGVSCLMMIIKTYKGNCSKEYLRELTYTTKDGTTAYDLVKAGEKFNFTSFGLRGGIKDIKYEYFPLIAHVIKDNKYQHFVVVYDFISTSKELIIADPASSGIRKIKLSSFEEITTNEYLIFIPNGKILNLKNNNRFYKLIFQFFYENISNLIVVFGLSLLFTILTIISTFYLQVLISKVLPSNFNFILLVFLLINILKAIFHYIRTKVLLKVTNKFDSYLNHNIYEHLFLLPDSYYENRTTGEVVSRITDLNDIKDMLTSFLVDIFISLLLSFLSFVVLIKINNILTMILCIFVFIEYIIYLLFKNKTKYLMSKLKEDSSKLYSYLTDTIKEITAIKHLDCSNFFINRFLTKYNIYLNTYSNYQKYYNIESFLINFITGVFNILVISLGYYYVLVNNLDISVLLGFLFLYPYFLEPFNKFFSLFVNIEDMIEALKRVNEFYQVDEKVSKYIVKSDFVFEKLQLEDICYSYKRQEIIINGLNLEIKAGEKILIFGNSGSGKTTLAKLISGNLSNYTGDILINGNKDFGKKDFLRKMVTYIRQDDGLLNMSLKENILLGRSVGEKEFLEVCKLLKIDEFVSKNVMKYDMQIEEDGGNLSAGEKQRVLLARGLFKDGDIFIFDENLSNLDAKMEREILENIFEYLKDKTVIVISHRFYNEDLFTRKIELRKGEVYG